MVLEDLLRRAWELTRYRRSPLGLELDGFCQWLDEQGYSRSVIRSHISNVSHFNQYLRYQGVRECREVQELHADRFISKHLRKRGRVSSRHMAAAVRCLIKYLSSRGVLRSTGEIPPPYQDVLDEYVEYLRDDRALADWPDGVTH